MSSIPNDDHIFRVFSIMLLLAGTIGCRSGVTWQNPSVTSLPLQVDAEDRVLVLPPEVGLGHGSEEVSEIVFEGILEAGGSSFLSGAPVSELLEREESRQGVRQLTDCVETAVFSNTSPPSVVNLRQAVNSVSNVLNDVGEGRVSFILVSSVRRRSSVSGGSDRWRVFGAVLAIDDAGIEAVTALRRNEVVDEGDSIREATRIGEMLATMLFGLTSQDEEQADEPAALDESEHQGPDIVALYSELSHLSPEARVARDACRNGDGASCERVCALFRLGRAATHYGRLFQSGRHFPRSLSKAAALFQRGCAEGHALGCNHLGHLFRQGLGVEPDPSMAERLSSIVLDEEALLCEVAAHQINEAQRRVVPFQPEWIRPSAGDALAGGERPNPLYRQALESDEVPWRPALFTLFGSETIFDVGGEERTRFAFDVIAGAQIGLAELADNGQVLFGIAPEVGYALRTGERYDGHFATIGLGVGFLFGFHFDMSLSVAGVFGTLHGGSAQGLRSGLRLSALASILHLRAEHQWLRAGDEDVHSVRFVAGVDIGFLVVFLLALTAM